MDDATETRNARRLAQLWTALLAGPVVWFAAFSADYALVRLACTGDTALPLHLVTLVSLALVLAGGWLAHRLHREAEVGRARFMATLGLLSAALFAGLIVAQWIPKLVLHPCMAL